MTSQAQQLAKHFAAMGADLEVVGDGRGSPRIDVRRDHRGERFALVYPSAENRRFGVQEPEGPVSLEVLDVDRPGRHLLLLMREGQSKAKFLCGHDERHWFVAAVPERELGVTGVKTAKAALQPRPVRERASRLKAKNRDRRHNEAFIRQGEWFFTPAPDVTVDPKLILRNEPLSRGRGSKPHMVAEAYRTGGTTVYVHRSKAPRGITQKAFDKLDPDERTGYTAMRRDPELYVRGTVRHADHATITLDFWHRVDMNTEAQSSFGLTRMAFLD
jgi:hypothetical protein